MFAPQTKADCFAQLPIAYDGRIKPLGRFAALLLKDISGQTQWQGLNASDWLAKTMFDPAWADKQRIFLVKDQPVLLALDLPQSRQHFTFVELSNAFVAHGDQVQSLHAQKELSKDQSNFLQLYARVVAFEQMRNAMTLLQDKISLKDRKQGENNQLLRVIPQQMPFTIAWLTPWQAKLQPELKVDPQQLTLWRQVARNYHAQKNWQKTACTLLQENITHAREPYLAWRLKAELLYQEIPFLSLVFVCYLLACALLIKRPRFGMPLLAAGFSLHILTLALRIFILQRPPVGTLYESTIFVAAIVIAAGWLNRRRNLLQPAIGLGAVLLLMGFGLNDAQDNFRALDAVLDTQFWLTVHVLVITGGYAVSLLTAVTAQRALWRTGNGHNIINEQKLPLRLSFWSLLLVAMGTLLGGIWADQSWGRFWNWDPKENGAFLIVLWLVWLLHSRQAAQLRPVSFTAGLALLGLWVALAWVGTNLLGVGLHSYGFITGVATALGIFCIAQIFVVWVLLHRIKKLAT